MDRRRLVLMDLDPNPDRQARDADPADDPTGFESTTLRLRILASAITQ